MRRSSYTVCGPAGVSTFADAGLFLIAGRTGFAKPVLKPPRLHHGQGAGAQLRLGQPSEPDLRHAALPECRGQPVGEAIVHAGGVAHDVIDVPAAQVGQQAVHQGWPVASLLEVAAAVVDPHIRGAVVKTRASSSSRESFWAWVTRSASSWVVKRWL